MLNLIRISDSQVVGQYSDAPAFVDLPGIGRAQGLGALVAGWLDPSGAYRLDAAPPPPPAPPSPSLFYVAMIRGRVARLFETGQTLDALLLERTERL